MLSPQQLIDGAAGVPPSPRVEVRRMHEVALCQSILEILREQAVARRFTRVLRVRLEIGALSPVDPQALAFGFDAVTRGSLADGARLDIDCLPGVAYCLACDKSVTIAVRTDPCPDCGGGRLLVTGGDEMRIKDLEVE